MLHRVFLLAHVGVPAPQCLKLTVEVTGLPPEKAVFHTREANTPEFVSPSRELTTARILLLIALQIATDLPLTRFEREECRDECSVVP